MRNAEACIEGYYCWYATTNTIMLNSKVEKGYFGGYNITGFAEFNLCKRGKYCPPGTATSKVEQLDCLQGFFCPLGTVAILDLDGNFKPGVYQLNKQNLTKAVSAFLDETRKYYDLFSKNIT